MEVPIHQIDAFTTEQFGGNSAAVCLLAAPRDRQWMQLVAREMNLSETAFLVPRKDGFDLRWFTPTVEVDLCGHATLASAHMLWDTQTIELNRVARFYTKSGELTAQLEGDWIVLDFPATPVEVTEPPDGLVDALGVTPIFVGKTSFDYMVVVGSEQEVRDLAPDHSVLRGFGVRGVVVTAAAESEEFDFVSRFFAPGSGVDEDPVTGSTHCCLGPYWAALLGKNELNAYQASERGGVIGVEVQEDRVLLKGRAVTIIRGELVAPR